MEKKAINLCDKIREEELEIPQSFDLSVKHLYDLQNNVPDKYDKICLAFKFGYMQAQRAEKANKGENDKLKNLLSQLRPEDYRIKRQIEAILYRYLEKRDRLPENPVQWNDRKKSIVKIVENMENEEYLELVERFAKNPAGSEVV